MRRRTLLLFPLTLGSVRTAHGAAATVAEEIDGIVTMGNFDRFEDALLRNLRRVVRLRVTIHRSDDDQVGPTPRLNAFAQLPGRSDSTIFIQLERPDRFGQMPNVGIVAEKPRREGTDYVFEGLYRVSGSGVPDGDNHVMLQLRTIGSGAVNAPGIRTLYLQ